MTVTSLPTPRASSEPIDAAEPEASRDTAAEIRGLSDGDVMRQSSPRADQLRDEAARHCALVRYEILDTEPEPGFERIISLVKAVFNVPMAAVSLIDVNRQWFKSMRGLDVRETPREVAFCDHTIRRRGVLAVPDARLDPRFCTNPLVTGAPFIRSYLGAPLMTPDGYNVGSLCVIDRDVRHFSAADEALLASFAALAVEEMELRQIAASDALTGLQTRRAFSETLDRVVRETRLKGDLASLVVFDLDHFKRINDTWGHPAGDAVLRTVADTCRTVAAGEATFGRIGGEEFAAVLADGAGQAALAFADRMRRAVERASVPGWPEVHVTASFGVADLEPSGGAAAMWMAAADAALYRAKKSGRNRVSN